MLGTPTHAHTHFISSLSNHDDVIKWKRFPRYCPFVRGLYRLPVDFHHKGQRRAALMLCLICAWTNRWANNRDAGDLRRHCVHCVTTNHTLITTYPPYLVFLDCKISKWKYCCRNMVIKHIYTLQSQYCFLGYRYSRMMFTNEYQLLIKLYVQKHLPKITSQC